MGFYSSCVVLVAVYIIVNVSCECDKNCKDCKDSKCAECQSRYFLDRKGICQICAENCRTCLNEMTCKTCARGLFPHPNGQCEPCGANCFRCANETNCELCLTQFTLKNGRCETCPENCNKCDENNECSLCNTGFYVKNGSCENCSPQCQRCSSYENCTECIPGSWGPACNKSCLYANYNISKCKEGNCDRDTGECIECVDGIFGVMCENPCPSNCQKNICDIHGNCSEGCLQGFYGDTCNNTCPKNCQDFVCAMNGNCTQGCNAGYYRIFCDKFCREFGNGCVNFECFRTNGACIQECPPNCIACISEKNCTACKTGYTLRNNTCCPQNCLNCDRDARCLKCYDGFYGDTCQDSCMENCKTCSSHDNCTECGLQFYDSKSELEAGLCMCDVRECKDDVGEEPCRECKQLGWYTHKRGCCPCPRYCKNQSDCKQLIGNCKNGCQRGWFGSLCDRRCNINCVTCTNYDICEQCKNEYYGHACQFNCSLGCVHSAEGPLCDVKTGHCLHGCESGTWGHTCNRTCSKNCVNGYCNSSTGHCLECHSTNFGHFCEKEAEAKLPSNNSTILIIVVCIATCVVLCITVIAVVMITRKCFERDNKDSIVNTASVEMDEINAQNILLNKPGSSGEGVRANKYKDSTLNNPADATYANTYQNITSCSRNRSVIRTTNQNTEMQTLPGTYDYVDVCNMANALNTYEALEKRDEHLYAESSYEALGVREEHVYSKSSYEALRAHEEHVYPEKSLEAPIARNELAHSIAEEPTYVNKTGIE